MYDLVSTTISKTETETSFLRCMSSLYFSYSAPLSFLFSRILVHDVILIFLCFVTFDHWRKEYRLNISIWSIPCFISLVDFSWENGIYSSQGWIWWSTTTRSVIRRCIVSSVGWPRNVTRAWMKFYGERRVSSSNSSSTIDYREAVLCFFFTDQMCFDASMLRIVDLSHHQNAERSFLLQKKIFS